MRSLSMLIVLLTSVALGGGSKSYVTLGTIEPITIKSGQKSEIIIPVSVKKGFHIQSNPASKKYLIPTTLKITKSPGIELGEVVYPKKVVPHSLEGSKDTINTYEGKIQFSATAMAKKSAKKGKRKIDASLRYQACNAKTCFFPQTLKIALPVTINK